MRRRPSRYRRSAPYSRRRRRNWAPFIIFVLVLSFFLWALVQFFSLLFTNVRTELSSTQLEILQGRGEFRLSGEESTWTPAFSGQNFVEGDQLQTAKNAHFKLTFFDQHHLFLNENSDLQLLKLERQSSGEVTAHWRLNRGELWGRIDHLAWAADTQAPDIKIYTPHSVVNITGTTFNLKTSAESDTLRLVQGGVKLDLWDPVKEAPGERITVSVGQEITVDQTTKQLLEPASALEIIDPEFLESDWHLKNLNLFEPETVSATREKIQARNAPPLVAETIPEETDDEELGPINPNLAAPQILSPAQNASIPASVDSIAIEGTAPDQAFQIQVNGYTLSKFQPGDRKWTYFAATKFNTLKSGTNVYRIVAIDRQGQRSPVTELNLNYEGVSNTSNQSGTLEASLTNFAPPKITTPPLFADDPTAIYQTSADRVTLFGEVPLGTNTVKVNGFQLRKFKPGDTKFQYTAIALGVNGNMQEGENQYTIVALGPDGKSSETTVKVVYTPLALAP